jgi:DnaK suppressor protein
LSQSVDLTRLRELLETKRKEFVDGVSRARAMGAVDGEVGAPDIADRATSASQREFSFFLSENESRILRLIDEALERLKNGRYGPCIQCQQPIEEARLEAIPWARHCISCQELQDRGDL